MATDESLSSPSKRWDGQNRAWEIMERQRLDLRQRREQLDFAGKRRAAAQVSVRVYNHSSHAPLIRIVHLIHDAGHVNTCTTRHAPLTRIVNF